MNYAIYIRVVTVVGYGMARLGSVRTAGNHTLQEVLYREIFTA